MWEISRYSAAKSAYIGRTPRNLPAAMLIELGAKGPLKLGRKLVGNYPNKNWGVSRGVFRAVKKCSQAVLLWEQCLVPGALSPEPGEGGC